MTSSSRNRNIKGTHGGVDVRAGGDEKQKINFAWPNMMAKVSAEDVAYEIGLPADELSKPCDSNIIPSLDDCFREWEVIFGSLLSEIDVDDVNKENTTGVKKRIAALRKWRDRKGREATYKVLVDALLNRGERYQAENLCSKILEHHSVSDKNGKYSTLNR